MPKFQILSVTSKLQLKNRVINLRKDTIVKKQFDIKAAIWGGVAALFPTWLILFGLILLGDVWVLVDFWAASTWGIVLILCGVSFILGMVCFGWKKVSEKDENPGD